jgi:hypothetical protein
MDCIGDAVGPDSLQAVSQPIRRWSWLTIVVLLRATEDDVFSAR